MHRHLAAKPMFRLAKAPLVLGMALALGPSGSAADTLSLAPDAPPIASGIAARFGTGWRLGDSKAALARQFPRRNAAMPRAPDRPAGTTTVANCDDSGAGSLRDAFANAVSGDVIDLTALSCSTITLTSGSLSTGVDDLTLHGPGAGLLAIDGNDSHRIIAHTGHGMLSINGMTLRNGSYTYSGPVEYAGLAPGACVLSDGNATITASAIEHCSAQGTSVFGAAIKVYGLLELTDSIVSGTTAIARSDELSATIYGGVIHAAATYLTRSTVRDAEISATSTTAFSGTLGGGVFGLYGVVLTDSVVSGIAVQVAAEKIAYAKGGGVASPSTVILSGSTVSNNTVRGTPGVGLSGDTTYISAIGGAGVYIASIPRSVPPASTITHSTISGNAAICDGDIGPFTVGGGGGLVSWSPLPVVITNSTLSGNSAATVGGGIYTRHRGSISLANATITNNTAPNGGGIADNGDESPYSLATSSSLVAGNHNLGTGAPVEIVTLHAITGANNLIGSANVALPPDTLGGEPLLGSLADNGGPTLTHALLPGSPALDAGNNPGGLTTDQRGGIYARISGAATDIGAFENQPPADQVFADGFD